jgi:hypothetical protein
MFERWLEPAYRQAGADDECLYFQFLPQASEDSNQMFNYRCWYANALCYAAYRFYLPEA